ncbi:hypothetical protein HAX54_027281 [Datura stramonium]|uniref:Protein kinase domain-containing protein n=1 Tax=Datura stramonium TaxID=4076 RepID=A0ABS8V468_DATST|nr:hypothetical protein [Datura stramonium]
MQRLSIMIDVAYALEYLHHGCSFPVIHRDLKPSNVLLDEDMVSNLRDFEYGRDRFVSTKCDVYSYGIILMETFIRRKPNDEMFKGDVRLKQWVSNSLLEAVMNIVDVNLITPTENRL